MGMTKSRGIQTTARGTRTRWATEEAGKHLCACGCGGPVIVRPEHYPQVKKFIHAHNTRMPRRRGPQPVATPCECGCGVLATPGRRYIHGHVGRGRKRSAETRQKLSEAKLGKLNPQYGKSPPNRKPRPAAVPCLCSCGELATPGRKYVTGHNTLGTRMPTWKGWYVGPGGYILREARDHPHSPIRKGYVLEHRLVMEEHLRATDPTSPYLELLGEQLYLRRDAVVHHIDGTKDNNLIENLLPLTNSAHIRLHHQQGEIHH